MKSSFPVFVFFLLMNGSQFLFSEYNLLELEQSLADVYVNNISGGTLLFYLDENQSPLIPSDSVFLVLRNEVKPELLQSITREKTLITTQDLGQKGISLIYNSSTLSLSFTLSPAIMTSQDLSEPIKVVEPKNGYYIAPNIFSVLMGTSLILTPAYNFGRLNEPSLEADLNLTPAIRIFDFVVEGALGINYNTTPSINLKSILISYDFPTIGARAYLGTINPPTGIFLNPVNLVGMGFTNGIGPRKRIYSGQSLVSEILLPRPSDLLLEINGVKLNNFHLPAGSYKLTDLPLDTGLNNLKLHIREAGGEQKSLDLIVPADGKLLSVGETEYSVNFGWDRQNFTKPFLLNKFSLGLTPFLEIRENASTDFEYFSSGGSLLWASPLGSFGITGAISMPYTRFASPGFASRLDWQLAFPGSPLIPKMGLSLEYRSQIFNSTQDPLRNASENINISSQITQALPIKLGTLGAYFLARFFGGVLQISSLSVGIFFPVFSLGSFTIFGGTDWHSTRGFEPRLSFSFSLVQENRNNLLYQQNILDKNESLELRFPLDTKDSVNLTLRESGILTQNTVSRDVSLSGNYLGESIILSASSNLTQSVEMDENQVWFEFRAASTLAFTGGHFGFLNGLPEAFVFLVPGKNLGTLPLVFHPPNGQEVVSTGGKPALAPGFQSYVPVYARVEMPDSLPEVRPFPENIKLEPTYRSGTVVEISSAPVQSFKGRLIDPKGLMVSGQIGKVFMSNDLLIPVGTTFTDEAGIFECYGVDFGDYSIVWSGKGISNFSFSGEGLSIIDLGDLKMITQEIGEKP